MDLFDNNIEKFAPLADRMRPKTLKDYIGQRHILGEGKVLRNAIEKDTLTNCIFFGPPGCGKTTLAHIIEQNTSACFFRLNAVTSGVADVRKVIQEAEANIKLYGKRNYLLLDECHRWNKAQSDSILPAIEKGIITLIGSTTENPMISMTGAIVSRCRVFEFYPLSTDDIKTAVLRAIGDKQKGFGDSNIEITADALEQLCVLSSGDIRTALNAVELAVCSSSPDANGVIHIDLDIMSQSIQRKTFQCDENQYYDMISAFCKSLRGSDENAALYWFASLIHAGVDPRLVVRRMVVHASEDIGLADPNALTQAVNALTALEKIGMPEARIPIAHAIIYICNAPKSNSVICAVDAAFSDVQRGEQKPVPMHLRDNHYKGAEKMGYGQGYLYPHDYEGHYIEQRYMPKGKENTVYYYPGDLGFEKEIRKIKENRLK